MPDVLLRSQWSDVKANFTPLGVPSPEAVQHHTGGAGPGQDLLGYLRSLEHGEMTRGDGLIALAYHWLVVNSGPHAGTRVEVRPWSVQGGATLHHNTTSRAVVITGDFTNETVTPVALDALADTWADGMRGGFIVPKPEIIQPHSLYFPTACCGHHMLDQLPALRALVGQKLKPQPAVDWTAILEMGAWEKRCATKPLRRGDRGPDVELAQRLLKHKHLLTIVGSAFGWRMAGGVKHGKRLAGYTKKEQDGNVIGGRFATWLLKP